MTDTDISQKLTTVRLIAELEHLLVEPHVRASVAELDRLIADDFVEVGALGTRFGKSKVLESLPRETGRRWELSNLEVTLLTEEVALVTFDALRVDRLLEPRTDDTAPAESCQRTRRSSIWKLNPQGWQMVYHQGTLLDR